MHPLLNEHIAELHMRELQQQAAAERLATEAGRQAGDPSPRHWLRYLLVGAYTPDYNDRQSEIKQEGIPYWLPRRMYTATREVGLGAMGVGFLAGGFLGTHFGLLPALVLSGIILLIISASIVVRAAVLLKKRPLPLARGR